MSEPKRALEPFVYVEPREASAVTQLVASGVGSAIGRACANAARLGPVGALVGAITGAVAGHFLVTHNLRLGEGERRETQAKYSDRR